MERSKAEQISDSLEDAEILFQHKRGSAVGEQFANDVKHGYVTEVFVGEIVDGMHYPVKVELDDGCATYIGLDEIEEVL